VALVVGSLSARLRVAAETAERRARHAEALREISRALSGADHPADLWPVAAAQAARALGGRALLVLRRTTDAPWLACGEAGPVPVDDVDVHRAEEVIRSGRPAPWADADATTLRLGIPVSDRAGLRGALLVERPLGPAWPPEGLELGEAIGLVTSEAMERVRLADQTQRMEVESRSERLRNALLSSVSHDLRTPLSVIVAATSHLADNGESLAPSERTGLAREAEREAERLNRLVGNLLSMTRLDAETIRPVKEWQPLEDVVGWRSPHGEGARGALGVRPPRAGPPARADRRPARRAGARQPARQRVSPHERLGARRGRVPLRRAQGPRGGARPWAWHPRGPARGGVRSPPHGPRGAAGPRLARDLPRHGDVHGGRIWAENRPDGGAAFRFTIPLEGEPPALPAEEVEESAAREGAP
jgi:two-component system sensor histidine kinase KdpD